MSTTTTSTTAASMQPRSSFARVPAAFRLHFQVKSFLIHVPLMVFFAAWAIALGIGFWLDRVRAEGPWTAEDPFYAGASQAVVWCLAFMAAYAASHNFPFSMALSFSRRVFLIGTYLAFAAVSAAYGVLFVLAALLERVTDGYGMHVYTFDLPFLTESSGIAGAGVLAAALCLMVMLVGFGVVILNLRMGLVWTWTVLLGLAVLVAVTGMLITSNDGWPAVGRWFSEQTSLTLALWTLPVSLVVGGGTYVMIRRATPS